MQACKSLVVGRDSARNVKGDSRLHSLVKKYFACLLTPAMVMELEGPHLQGAFTVWEAKKLTYMPPCRTPRSTAAAHTKPFNLCTSPGPAMQPAAGGGGHAAPLVAPAAAPEALATPQRIYGSPALDTFIGLYVLSLFVVIIVVSIGLALLHGCARGSCNKAHNPYAWFYVVVVLLGYSQLPILLLGLVIVLAAVALGMLALLQCTSRGCQRGGQTHPPSVFIAAEDVVIGCMVLVMFGLTVTGLVGLQACVFGYCRLDLGAKRSLNMVISGYVVNTIMVPFVLLAFFGNESDPRYPKLCSRKRWQAIRPVQVQDSCALPV